jgi:hypothetical protein
LLRPSARNIKNYAGSETLLPTFSKKEEPLWYCKTPPPKERGNINGDQAGCSLDLKPSLDEN